MSELKKQIDLRRTFAIISHPDAGKTTMTEKLLLYGGAIQMAGTVKAKRSKKFATSDWMALEKERGISVSSSVMKFPYMDHEINLIDTPGHEDFSEDTYRTLTAVDSALMLIDGANGVETQTKKLFEVCALRRTPIITFVNKLDRESKDPFDLMDEIEKVLGIKCYPMTWPIGTGAEFKGVYHREKKQVLIFDPSKRGAEKAELQNLELASPVLKELIGEDLWNQLSEEVELLDAAGESFDHQQYREGKLAPIFFGSALNNFGVEVLLQSLIALAPPPLERDGTLRTVSPYENKFTGFVYKIQANMDPSHRDRVAFIRIVSGKFERGMKAFCVRHKRQFRLGRPTQFMAQDRSLVDEAYAGDIVGIHDPGQFKIGDTFSEGEGIQYTGIPVFAPEHFVRVVLKDPLKSKQLNKALDQLSEEGAVQVFRPVISNDQFLGVVGVLQFDVVKFRIQAEYGVQVTFEGLPYSCARWVDAHEKDDLDKFVDQNKDRICFDQHENPTILLNEEWQLKVIKERNPSMLFYQTSEATDEA